MSLVVAAPAFATNSAPVCAWGVAPNQSVEPGIDNVLDLKLAGDGLSCTDADDDHLAVRVVSGPAHGAVSPARFWTEGVDSVTHAVDLNGQVELREPGDAPAGADQIVVRVTDGQAETGDITVPFDVASLGADPISCPPEGGPTELYNNTSTWWSVSCSASAPVSFAVTSAPAHGKVLPVNHRGDSLYVPDRGFTGTDSVTLLADDGHGHTATVSRAFTVMAPSAPTCDQTGATDDNMVQGATYWLWLDGCQWHGALEGHLELVSHDGVGTWTTDSDGYVSFVAPGAFTGDVHFAYRLVTDLGTSNTVNGVLHVAAPGPVAATTCQDSNWGQATTRAGHDAQVWLDCTGSDTTYTIDTAPAHGTLTPIVDSPGSYTYTPAGGFAGVDSFVWHGTNSGGSSSAVRSFVTVVPADPTAVGANTRPTCSAYGADVKFQTRTELGAGCWDFDGDAVTLGVTAQPSHGTLGALGTWGDGAAYGNYFPYTPAAGFEGLDRYSFAGNDGVLTSATTDQDINVLRGPLPVSVQPTPPVQTTPPATTTTTTPAPVRIAPPPAGRPLANVGGISLLDVTSGKGTPGQDGVGVDPVKATVNLGTAYNSLTVPVQFGAAASVPAPAGRVRVALTAKAKKKVVVLGSVNVKLAPGEVATLKFKVSAKARKALGNAKTVKATIVYTVRPQGGQATSTTKTVTLKVAKAKKKAKK